MKRAEYARELNYLKSLFGEVHIISIKENTVSGNFGWINESMARLFVHSRIYQCSRYYGSDVIKTMTVECPGGCGLRKHKKKTWRKQFRKIAKHGRSNMLNQ